MTTSTPVFQSLWDAPMSDRGFIDFRLRSDLPGVVSWVGQEQGKLTILTRSDVAGLGTVVTLHEEGRSYWAMRGQRGYAPARVHTILLGAPTFDERPTVFRYVRLTSTEVPNATERANRSILHSTAIREG